MYHSDHCSFCSTESKPNWDFIFVVTTALSALLSLSQTELLYLFSQGNPWVQRRISLLSHCCHILSFLNEDVTLVYLVFLTWCCLPPDKKGNFAQVYVALFSQNVLNSLWLWSVLLYIDSLNNCIWDYGLKSMENSCTCWYEQMQSNKVYTII